MLKLIECNVPIWQQLEVEEALLRVGEGSWCILNHGSPPAIVLGLSSLLQTHVDLERVQKQPIPLIRRFSGGGTVVIDEDTLFFTLILEKETNPHALMHSTGELLAPAFAPHILCVEEHDFAIQGKKIGGNAQSFCKGRALHHTSFLWSWKKELMEYLKIPPHQPLYRRDRSHEEFCGQLSSFFPSKQFFLTKLTEELSHHFSLERASFLDAQSFLTRPYQRRLQSLALS